MAAPGSDPMQRSGSRRDYVDLDNPANFDQDSADSRGPDPFGRHAERPVPIDEVSDEESEVAAGAAGASGAAGAEEEDNDEDNDEDDEAGSTTQIQRTYPPGLLPHLMSDKNGYLADREARDELLMNLKQDNRIQTSSRTVQWFFSQMKEGVYCKNKVMGEKARALRASEQELVCQFYNEELDADHPGHMDKNSFYRADKCTPQKLVEVEIEGVTADTRGHTAEHNDAMQDIVAGRGHVGSIGPDDGAAAAAAVVNDSRQLPDHTDHYIDSDCWTSKLYPNLVTLALVLGKWSNTTYCDKTTGGIFNHHAQDDDAILSIFNNSYCVNAGTQTPEEFSRQCVLINSCKTLKDAKSIPELRKILEDMVTSGDPNDVEAAPYVGGLMTDAYRVMPAMRKAIAANDIAHFWRVKVGEEYLFSLRDVCERMIPKLTELVDGFNPNAANRMADLDEEIARQENFQRKKINEFLVENWWRATAHDRFQWIDNQLASPYPTVVFNGERHSWECVQKLSATYQDLNSYGLKHVSETILNQINEMIAAFKPQIYDDLSASTADIDIFLGLNHDFHPVDSALLDEREALSSAPAYATIQDALADKRHNDAEFDADCRWLTANMVDESGDLVCQLPRIVARACDERLGNGMLAPFFDTAFEYANKFHRLPKRHRSMLKSLKGLAQMLECVIGGHTCAVEDAIDHFKKILIVVKTFETGCLDVMEWFFLKGRIEPMVNHSICSGGAAVVLDRDRTCNVNEHGLPVYGPTPTDRDPNLKSVKIPIFAKPHIYLAIGNVFSQWAQHLNMLQTVKRKHPDLADMTDEARENQSKRVHAMQKVIDAPEDVVDQILALLTAPQEA